MKEGLDLIGLGKLAKAIPPGAWERATQTACETFEKCLAPLTETTSGVGRLIAAKFDRFTGLEKINAAAAFERAKAKIEASGMEPIAEIQPKVLIATIEGAALETDEDMQELWANLIAEQFTVGGVHPQIPAILSKLTPPDAQTLAKFQQGDSKRIVARLLMRNLTAQNIEPSFAITSLRKKETLSEAVLASCGLIRKDDIGWGLTALGRAFIKAVQGPTAKPDSGNGDGSVK